MSVLLSPADAAFLDRAVTLSRQGMEGGAGGPFGAVIVLDGTVVGEGCNRVTSTNDPTAHAEMVAIREACTRLGRFDLNGATLYASCEPCPMCLSAIFWARIARVVFANTRDQAAAIGFDDALIYEQVPLPPADRSIPCEHRPSPGAAAVFRDWLAKPDRVPY